MDALKSLSRLSIRQLAQQALNFCLIASSALMIWKGLSVVTNSESPIVVVLSESMEPAFARGDLLFLTLPSTPVTIGDICVFKIQDKPIPIVHRVLEIHAAQNGSQYMLTKGDNNPTDDRGLYNRGQMWIRQEDVVGKVQGFLPHVGLGTILLNEHPQQQSFVERLNGTIVEHFATFMFEADIPTSQVISNLSRPENVMRRFIPLHPSFNAACRQRPHRGLRHLSSQASALREPTISSSESPNQVSDTKDLARKPAAAPASDIAPKAPLSASPPMLKRSSRTTRPPAVTSDPSSLAAHVAEYPWLLSTQPARRPRPTFWSVLRDKHFLAVGTARARKHLNHPTYDFPDQFCDDAGRVARDLFAALSDPLRAKDEAGLAPVLVRAVAERFAAGARSLTAKGLRVEYVLKGEPKVTVTGTHFTYGPYPAPAGFVAQQWWSLIELVIPEEDGTFSSHPRQKEIMQRAADDGVFFKVDTRVACDVEMILSDAASGMPIIRDRRRNVDLQFVSPHFTPWDEVFELDEQGEWLLRWKWRISDIDWLVESSMPKVEQKPTIDWRPRRDV
ncbi:Signal peptidase complex catalytic subunit S11A [Geranomyces variabilis]|nr:Signal peptidase complex catalytic subunit S11A [Geranomyces variabilis]